MQRTFEDAIETFEATSFDELKANIRSFLSGKDNYEHKISRKIVSLSHSSISDSASPTGQLFTAILVYNETMTFKNYDSGGMF